MFCVPTGHGMRELRSGSADGLAAQVGPGRPLGPGTLPDCGSGDHGSLTSDESWNVQAMTDVIKETRKNQCALRCQKRLFFRNK
jgi:hypothetical protein